MLFSDLKRLLWTSSFKLLPLSLTSCREEAPACSPACVTTCYCSCSYWSSGWSYVWSAFFYLHSFMDQFKMREVCRLMLDFLWVLIFGGNAINEVWLYHAGFNKNMLKKCTKQKLYLKNPARFAILLKLMTSKERQDQPALANMKDEQLNIFQHAFRHCWIATDSCLFTSPANFFWCLLSVYISVWFIYF